MTNGKIKPVMTVVCATIFEDGSREELPTIIVMDPSFIIETPVESKVVEEGDPPWNVTQHTGQIKLTIEGLRVQAAEAKGMKIPPEAREAIKALEAIGVR